MSVITADNKPSQPMAVASHTHSGTGTSSNNPPAGQTEGATEGAKYVH